MDVDIYMSVAQWDSEDISRRNLQGTLLPFHPENSRVDKQTKLQPVQITGHGRQECENF
jgi:hypothetical protein